MKMMKSNEQYYRDLAANTSTTTISGSLLRGYASRMAVVETPAPFVGSGEQYSARAAIRAEYRAAARDSAAGVQNLEFSPGMKGRCYIFADGSFLRADAFN
jgi:hypothetical protein